MVIRLPCLLPDSAFLHATIALTGFAIEHSIEFVEVRRRAKYSERTTCLGLLFSLETPTST